MFQVSDLDELHALLGALLKYKFFQSPSDPDVQEVAGSPIIANILNKLYESTIKTARSQLNELSAKGWESKKYFSPDTHPFENRAVIGFARECDLFLKKWSFEERAKYIRLVLSPYEVSDEHCQKVIQQATTIESD
jgi:hypothetical protein